MTWFLVVCALCGNYPVDKPRITIHLATPSQEVCQQLVEANPDWHSNCVLKDVPNK
jgi:hypothetical protein